MKKQTTQKTSVWLGCYIYFTLSADNLLIEKILPIIQEIFKKKWANQYFFIRYSDSRDLHIRLRFKGEKDILETRVQPLLKQTFPNSRFSRYQQELNRYGGIYGIVLAEKIFEASSNVILSFLKENEPTYEQSLGFALQLNICMSYALGMDKVETIAFFDHLASNGEKSLYTKNFEKQKDAILPFLSQLWSSLEEKIPFDKPWFNNWIQTITDIGKEIKRAYTNNKLYPLDPKKGHPQNPLWYLYESYIHMNNNRLGIYNMDEPYIAYILKETLD
jgi:thiopeptide-type bacteriocin biosynthesis protein